MYSWGCGQNGRLGNGSEEDSLVPRELVEFSKLKPQFISAGESHSAAITDKLKLFTWGNGGYGRLGQGIDSSERNPKLVEDLD
jgi:alpha-tubulin suppressor-like RCC1 family protein